MLGNKSMTGAHGWVVDFVQCDCRTVEENDNKFLQPCGPGTPGAEETTLTQIAEKGQAAMVAPPPINMKMFKKVLQKARPTVSAADLDVYKKFTAEFGEEG